MTQENKELLLKDLCARLPYGVKGNYLNEDKTPTNDKLLRKITITYHHLITASGHDGMVLKGNIKPYLFPLSSMTDKELIEFLHIRGMNLNSDELKTFRNGETAIVSTLPLYSRHIDWLNAHHFDYRGLIDKGLANDATGLNIY